MKKTIDKIRHAILTQRDEDLKNGGFPYVRADGIGFLEDLGYRKIRGDEDDASFFFVVRG